FTFKKGEEFDLSILDPNGAAIRTRKVALGDFGTFSEEIALHAEAPVGEYHLVLSRKPARGSDEPPFSAQGSFRVAVYRLEKVRLTLDLPKSVYLRGEEIKGKVVARYYYGEPLAKRKLQFGWGAQNAPDTATTQEVETDEKGEASFTIPTRPFEEEA